GHSADSRACVPIGTVHNGTGMPLFLQGGGVAEGVVTHGTAPFTGHGFGRSPRGNERQAPALAPQGGDVCPVVQVDQLHFLPPLSLTSALPHRSGAETEQIGIPWESSLLRNGEPPSLEGLF